MKKLIFLLGMCVAFNTVNAEDHTPSLEYSVFSGYRHFKAVDRNAIMAKQKLVMNTYAGWSADIDKLNSSVRDMFGPAMNIQGVTNAQKAQNFMAQQASILGVEASQWKQVRDVNAGHASFVDYHQYIDGHQVTFSTLSFRFTTDGRLVRVKMRNYGAPKAGLTAVLSDQDVLSSEGLTQDLADITVFNKVVTGDWEWFPVPEATGYTLRPAKAFKVTGLNTNEMPVELTGYVDAVTGKLLYRTNNVKETFEVTVNGSVIKDNANMTATSLEPMQELRIRMNGTNYNADASGFLSVASLNAPQTATLSLRGPWANVVTNGGNTNPSANNTFNTSGTTYTFPAVTSADDRHINAYYHVNVIHELMKNHMPSFTGMDNPLTTNVDIQQNTCNAYYNGNSINFFAPNSSCRGFSEIADIIYHEYGHGISRTFYQSQGAGGMANGALNEGCSDIWAMSILPDGIVGEGAFNNPSSNIRSYTGTPKVFPVDIRGEVHADGEIIAGAWWDLAVATSSTVMTDLFTKTYFDVPDGPTGTEGLVYHDVLISAILNDDNDGNLSNGTPHFQEIRDAFARHGIYLMSDAELNHTELAHQTVWGPTTVNASLTLSNSAFFGDLVLYFKSRGATDWDSVTMTQGGSMNFTAQITPQASGSITDYYFSIFDVLNDGAHTFPNGYRREPSMASFTTIPYQFASGVNIKTKVDFETEPTDWTIGGVAGDNATGGTWIRATPVASYYNAGFGADIVQPGNDHTTGSGTCLVTGNAATAGFSPGTADVDNGKTTVLTPEFDLSGFNDPIIEYYRWYSNDRGSNARSDIWNVQISNTLSFLWRNVEYTYQSDYEWRRRIFKVSEFWTGASKIQMRFVAEDALRSNLPNNGQGIVEAAVDDFFIYDAASLSVDNVNVQKANIYPNPADDRVVVELPEAATGTIKLYDVTGKVLSTQAIENGKLSYTVNTSSLAAGTYFVTIQTGASIQSQHVVVQH